MRPHPKRARTDPYSPRAWATCDRSGFLDNHENLQWQYEWAGTQLINKRILCAPDQIDEPQRQLGTIILPPDPEPIPNARPENYTLDESTLITTTTVGTAVSGTTVINVLDTTGFTSGTFGVVELDNGALPRFTITVINGTTMTLDAKLPWQCSSGNLVSYVIE